MDVKVCKNCRRLFKYISGPEICHDCIILMPKEEKERIYTETKSVVKPLLIEDEEKYEKVKDYIMAHPKATILQISEENGLTPMKIFEWIREDRLEFSNDSTHAWFECGKCGTKIKSGTLCYKCKADGLVKI